MIDGLEKIGPARHRSQRKPAREDKRAWTVEMTRTVTVEVTVYAFTPEEADSLALYISSNRQELDRYPLTKSDWRLVDSKPPVPGDICAETAP